jgi:hypothetical protein
VAELFHNSKTKGERGKMTARIPGLIQGIAYKVAGNASYLDFEVFTLKLMTDFQKIIDLWKSVSRVH